MKSWVTRGSCFFLKCVFLFFYLGGVLISMVVDGCGILRSSKRQVVSFVDLDLVLEVDKKLVGTHAENTRPDTTPSSAGGVLVFPFWMGKEADMQKHYGSKPLVLL